jgi:hypothetical protein
MTTHSVTIDRMRVTVHSTAEGARADQERTERLLNSIFAADLAKKLAGTDIVNGYVCIDCLRLPLPLVQSESDNQLGAQWSSLIANALIDTGRASQARVIRYSHPLAALVDVVCGVATRQLGRRWAWLQTGVCQPDDPDPAVDPASAIVVALRRHPTYAAGAMIESVRKAGVEALDRVLGDWGWLEVTTCLWPPPAAADSSTPSELLSRRASRIAARSRVLHRLRSSRVRPTWAAATSLAIVAIAEVEPALLQSRDASALRARIAHDFIRSSDEPRVSASIASRDSDDLRQRRGAELLEESGQPEEPGRPIEGGRSSAIASGQSESTDVECAMEATPHFDGGSDLRVERSAEIPPRLPDDREDGELVTTSAPARARSTSEGAGIGELPRVATSTDLDVGAVAGDALGNGEAVMGTDGALFTNWAGLVFLLAVADDIGMPDQVLCDPVLAVRPMSWVLTQVGVRLVRAEIDDPAVAAFAGRPAADLTIMEEDAAADAENTRLDELATDWATATADRLLAATTDPTADDIDYADPAATVIRVAHRPGHIDAVRGWIEVVLSAAQADVLVRRAGLDLDPDWVPWLGTVVRYRYV